MAKKYTTVRITDETAKMLHDLKGTSGASSLNEEISNIVGRCIVNGQTAHKLAELLLISAAIVDGANIPTSTQIDITDRLDPQVVESRAARVVAELRADLIEFNRRSSYAAAALGGDPKNMSDVDLPAVIKKNAVPARRKGPE